MVSDIIRERLVKAGVPFHANDCIASVLEDGDIDRLKEEVERKGRGAIEKFGN